MNLKPKGTVSIPRAAREGLSLLPWCKEVNRCLQQLRDRIVTAPSGKRSRNTKPPLWGTLTEESSTLKLYMELGYVFARKNATGDAITEITITDLPEPDDLLTVAVDDKVSVKITIGATGLATAAEIHKATSWPESLAPVLAGGDNSSGTAGYHYVRVLEIIDNPDNPGTPTIKQHLTGHIDYFQPTLSDNTISSPSGGQARVLSDWNAASGRWDFRYIEAGSGVGVAESGDAIVISSASAHPWKVTNGGSGNATVAAGFALGYFHNFSGSTPSAWDTDPGQIVLYPDEVILGFSGEFAGGNVAITGTQYIYAEISRTDPPSTYSESYEEITLTAGAPDVVKVGVQLGDTTAPDSSHIVTLVASSSAPNAYSLTLSGNTAICIAKVTNTAGTITVDKQYVTHNPTLSVPVINLNGSLA